MDYDQVLTMIDEAIVDPDITTLAAVLGMEETQILHTLMEGPWDVQSIHFITGIPVPCIDAKLRALVGIGLVRTLGNGQFESIL